MNQEHDRVLQELRQTLARLETALNVVHDALVIIDREGQLIWCNRSFESLMGRSRLLSLGQPLEILLPTLHQAGQPVSLSLIVTSAAGDGCLQAELLTDSSVQTLEIEWSISALPQDVSWILTIRDISERVAWQRQLVVAKTEMETQVQQRTEELRRARDEALAANQAKSQFLANMSHEIRTPLNAVIGMADILAVDHLLPPQQEQVETIRSSGKLLLNLIDNILDFSKIEAGEIQLDPQEFDLISLLNDCQKLVDASLKKNHLCFNFYVETGVPKRIFADRLRLQQIILNLLSNAIKFTQQGSIEVTVSADSLAESRLFKLAFAVRDTGIGIPEQIHSELFQPFRQGDYSITRRYGGTGLGLAICHSLCKAMGGDILINSAVGLGSEVKFTILAYQVAPVNRPLFPPPTPDTVSKNLTILVAEDYPINQQIIQLFLQKLGHTCICVNNGAEAIAYLEHQAVDLVLMDLEMPELDGISATQQLRQSGQLELPIVALTAHVLPEHYQACTAAGMNDFLSKPIRFKDLQELLNRYVQSLKTD